MHNVDRTQLEFGYESEGSPALDPYGAGEAGEAYDVYSPEYESFEAEEGWSGQEAEWGEETEGPLDEVEEMELAGELLEVTDEAELEQFLGRLVRKAARGAGRFLRSPAGRSLRGLLRNTARRFLPGAGQAVGNLLLPGIGGPIGARLASQAGRLLGLELEGLSAEDQEFEAARQFVRFAADATQGAAEAESEAEFETEAEAGTAVQAAVVGAARQHAPGLVPLLTAGKALPATGARGGRTSGRWVRRGRTIILIGV